MASAVAKPEAPPERKYAFAVNCKVSIIGKILNVPDCPGTESEHAGKASACAGCPNQNICSAAPKGPDPGIAQVKERWL